MKKNEHHQNQKQETIHTTIDPITTILFAIIMHLE